MIAGEGKAPSLEQYVETRLNLLTETIKEKGLHQDAALAGFIEATRVAHLAYKAAVETVLVANDLRYQQRFEAQSDALAAAFLSQQTAMQTAFVVAEKAVQSALAAADRAVSKAELAADKRFEALNELRQMLNDMVTTLFPRTEAVAKFAAMDEKISAGSTRVDSLEARFNTLSGQLIGFREQRVDTRQSTGLSMQAVSLLLAAILFLIAVAAYVAKARGGP